MLQLAIKKPSDLFAYICIVIGSLLDAYHFLEGTGLVSHLVFKTSSRQIKLAVAGSIPALSAFNVIIMGWNRNQRY